MSGFYIKGITVNDTNGCVKVKLNKGLNIIRGRSITKMDSIAECFDFIFGSSVYDNPFKDFSSISMVVSSNDKDGEIKLKRDMGNDIVGVTGHIDGIDSEFYYIDKPQKTIQSINDVWLKLIGVEYPPMIVKNDSLEEKQLDWNDILHAIFLDKKRIDSANSIIKPDYTENNSYLSSLLYLFTGVDNKENRIRNEVYRKTLNEYVERKTREAYKRKEQLEKDLLVLEFKDVEEKFSEAMSSLSETNDKINHALADGKRIVSSIMKTEEAETECDLLLNRFKKLESQFKADIKRLSFIVEGEEAYNNVLQSDKCPYCDGAVSPRKRTSYIAAAKAELERIIAQLSGLLETEKDIEDRKKKIQSEIEDLKQQYEALKSEIETEPYPQGEELNKTISDYKEYLRISSEIALLEKSLDDFNSDVCSLESDYYNEILGYNLNEYFGFDFASKMSEYASGILKECGFPDFKKAHFNVETFDIEVNGKSKDKYSTSYRSYFNTVMILTLRKFMANYAKLDPHLFIIDSPLHRYRDNKNNIPDSLKEGLYRYFMNHQNEGQLIIIDNFDNIPDLDYKEYGIVVKDI